LKICHLATLPSGLVVGFLILSTWAWNIVCAPDVFAWYFSFMLLNVGQLLYILYQMRPIQFDPDLVNAALAPGTDMYRHIPCF
jgi:hypothetical protein